MSNLRPSLRPNLRNVLLSGASLATLLAAQPALAQNASSIRGTAATGASGGARPGTGAPVTTLPPTAEAALTRQNAMKARTATAMDLANQAQQAARSAALAKPSTVPNGLGSGGLLPAGAITSNPALWQNANAPTQVLGADGKTLVTIDQTAAKAFLTWDSFNVGKDTTVYFDQSKGTQADKSNEWIALNRINDPSLAPSQIQGQIKAEGSVYLINRNGIIFSGTSQVNTHSLIASSLSFFGENQNDPASVAATNARFLAKGLSGTFDVDDGSLNRVILGAGQGKLISPTGDVTIEAGALIETKEGGFALLAAPLVTNAGSIVGNGGQTFLAAAGGLRFPSVVNNVNSNLLTLQPTGVTGSEEGFSLTNTGIVTGLRGTIMLLGESIDQKGIVLATSSIQQPGTIMITGATVPDFVFNPTPKITTVTFGSDSLTAILPDANGGTTTSSAAADAVFKPGTATIAAFAVHFEHDALAYMPGATMNVLTQDAYSASSDPRFGRLQIDEGAVLSVAGFADIERPMSDNLVTVPRLGQNELADSPLQRDGILYTTPFTVDSRDSGTRDDGLSWVGTPIANVGGYVQNEPRSVTEMLVDGGTINLGANYDLIIKSGATIDVSGGFEHFLGGATTTSRLIGADGRIYSAATADPMMTYVGFAGETVVTHSRWGVTDHYSNGLMNGGYESDYVEGGNGGSLNIFANRTTILDGALIGTTILGRHQIASGNLPQGATLNLGSQDVAKLVFAAQVFGGGPAGYGGGYLLTKDGLSLDTINPDFAFDTSIVTPQMLAKDLDDPTNLLHSSILSTDIINAGGFTNVRITGTKAPVTLAADANIAVQSGGSIDIAGAGLTILGDLTARSGQITLLSDSIVNKAIVPQVADNIYLRQPGDIIIGGDARIDASGQWVNDSGVVDGLGSNFINGGSVTIQASLIGLHNVDPNFEGIGSTITDLTGSVILKPGSVIDVSSGGYVNTLGQVLTDGGVPVGKGGDISLGTDVTGNTTAQPNVSASGNVIRSQGRLELGGTLLGYGLSGGGTLALWAGSIQIGGDTSGLPAYALYLPADYFDSQGFGAYKLTAAYDATIAAGTKVRVSQRNYVADVSKLGQLATGGDISSVATLGMLDAYHRQSTDFTLASGDYLHWLGALDARLPQAPSYIGVTGTTLLDTGAAITADAGAEVTLSSLGHVTALGAITTPGGSIALRVDPSIYSGANGAYQDHGVWLGADALLDAAGTVLIDPLAAPMRGMDGAFVPRTGHVLAGGSVSLTALNGYLVTRTGSRIDVSGTSGTFDLRSDGNRYLPTAVWSDGGEITLGATNGTFLDGTLIAGGGSDRASGGTLTLAQVSTALNVNGSQAFAAPDAILLRQSGAVVPEEAGPGGIIDAGSTIHFAVDRLDGSGIDTLVLGADPAREQSIDSTRPPMSIGFVGDIDLTLGRAIIANARDYVLLPQGTDAMPLAGDALPGNDSHVSITAPYVALGGNYSLFNFPFAPATIASGGGTLDVQAGTIDLTGRFNIRGVASSDFVADGDIRFYTPAAYAFDTRTTQILPGMLVTGGDLTFQAAQLYPATGNAFVLTAPGDSSTITFLGNGKASPLPLSAAGALLVDAHRIVQNGTLRAPSGNIQLGVGDIADPDAIAAFGAAPLVRTESVTLSAGSVTSVSLDERSLPYGTTTDGTDWRLVINDTGYKSPDLTSAPQKFIGIAGDHVTLATGSMVDLSGGGNIYAQEFVPGTGGSRDLLNAVNTVYSTGATPQQTPLYADGRPIYAVIPSYAGGVAAYDPGFSGSQGAVGKSVYLSGVNGLPDGIYTLLPAQYATIPGAFRVVQQTQITDSVAADGYTQPDGDQIVSGRFVDGITGKSDARTTSFLVQSDKVWKQYSEYAITDADDYFPAQADHASTSATRTPADAGRLVLAAVDALILDGALKTTAGDQGRGASVDISAQAIQILGGSSQARDGYLQLSATALSNLGAESLLIGGTRSDGATGTTINVAAQNVVLSNDSNSALTGPEIILVAGTGGDAGLLIESGSVLAAKGDITSPSTAPILIGKAGGASGDGALVRVSNGGAAAVIRSNVPGLDGVAGTATGLLDIRDGASIGGGKSAILDATGNVLLDPGAGFSGDAIDVNANAIAFLGDDSAAIPNGFVVGDALLAQLASVGSLGLHSRSTMTFYGDVDLATKQSLVLGAAAIASDGGTVSISAPKLTLLNDIGGSASFATGSGTLTLNADELDFGAGAKTLQGFATVGATAIQGIVGQGSGSFDFGDLDVTLAAPVFTADSGANTSFVTTGMLTLANAPGTAINRETLGGGLSFTGGTLVDGALITTPAGNVTLHATSGDLVLDDGAIVKAAGVSKPFRDLKVFAPGGAVALMADTGSIRMAATTTIDFSGAADGGDAGSLSVSAPSLDAQLLGTIKGNAAVGYLGGSISLDTGGAIDLGALTARLVTSGITRNVTVHSRTGNLALFSGDTIKASAVTLIADGGNGIPTASDGNVLIAGTIDASSDAGGTISLAGKSGVTLTGKLLATGSDPAQRGGTVRLATGGVASGDLNSAYGYELVNAAGAGTIAVGSGAVIDVSGGTAGGLSGGTVAIRAPLLAGDEVNVTIDSNAAIKGARDVGLEAYAVWSTNDTQQTDKSKYFDGIIDPAGWYNADGSMVAGNWADNAGNALAPPADDAELKAYLEKYIFTPDTANADHQTFYGYAHGDEAAAQPGTLMGFIQNPVFTFARRFAGIANFTARPGVELRNPDSTVNNGDISVLTPWNLGAGTDPATLGFRFGNQAPLLTIRALGNVNVRASISDGFWQYAAANGAGAVIPTSDFATVDPASQTLFGSILELGGDPGTLFAPEGDLIGDPVAVGQYYALYQQYLDFLATPGGNVFNTNYGTEISFFPAFAFLDPDPSLAPPSPPTTAKDYPAYFQAYAIYFGKVEAGYNSMGGFPIDVAVLAPPPTTLDVIVPASPIDNSPSPLVTAGNPLPLASATLAGGSSSSYRIVAGADLNAVDPFATDAVAGRGDIVVDDHLSWISAAAGGTINSGTMIRTGTGAIDLVAARDVVLRDPTAPGTIYTAGAPATGTTADEGLTVIGTDKLALPALATGEVHPEAAGDLTIHAGRDISGVEQIYTDAGNYAAQLWWPWLQTDNPTVLNDSGFNIVAAASINFGNFGQGLMSIGGNVAIDAGRDIRQLSVSLPTTWYKTTDGTGSPSITYIGGGDLAVESGGDILGGSYFVSKGKGRITAGGAIGSAFTLTTQGFSTPLSTLLALQDAVMTVSARGAVDIGGIYNPSWLDLPTNPDFTQSFSDGQPYTARSGVSLSSVSGDVRLDTLKLPLTLFSNGAMVDEVNNTGGPAQNGRALPASLAVTSFISDIYVGGPGELYPSATGALTLLANGSIQLVNAVGGDPIGAAQFGMSDAPTSYLPSPLNPIGFTSIFNTLLLGNRFDAHQAGLHAQDSQPVRIYGLTGDIVDGAIAQSGLFAGFTTNGMALTFPKVAQLFAGRDIVNLTFEGQNNYASDVTSIVAGRNILNTPMTANPQAVAFSNVSAPVIEIGGPGYFDVEAGRDLGPLVGNEPITGIRAVGDLYNASVGRGSADISVLFGTAPGVAWDAFAAAYLDPHAAGDVPSFDADLIDAVSQYAADQDARAGGAGARQTLTADQAWATFQTMPLLQRQALIERAFFKVLQITGADYADPASPFFNKYARGYQAIEALFPSSLGYTRNNLEGGANGAATQVPTGDLDIRGSTIQTQQGGNVNIIGPGGRVLVGSTASPPYLVDTQGNVLVGPQALGILAWENGAVNIFSDQSLLLAQSRIFTERGGNITIWSSNGDINAGKGSKTSTEQPPLKYVCTPDYFCRIDSGAAVSGAGIAAFAADAGETPPTVTLVAPRGTVDAGDAGIRVAGNLIVAAQFVANADNIQVQGQTIGVPTGAVDVGANLAASNSAANAAQEAVSAMRQARQNDQPSVITVTIVGFGMGADN